MLFGIGLRRVRFVGTVSGRQHVNRCNPAYLYARAELFYSKAFRSAAERKADRQNNYEKAVLFCLNYSWRGVGGAISVKYS